MNGVRSSRFAVSNHICTEETPLVSIVTTSFNQAQYIEEAIESVLAQDYGNIEYIVLDDGSTDDTEELLRRYTGKLYWERQPNMGQAKSLNKGWGISKGTILSYLSADDALAPHAVRIAVENLVRHPETVLVFGDYHLMDAKGRTLRRVYAPEFDYLDMVANTVCQPGPGVFFRREAFDRVGGWNANLRQIPDYEYWLRLGLRGSFLRIPEPIAQFRVHEESQSYGEPSVEKSEECISVIREYFDRDDLPSEVRAVERQAHGSAHVIAARFHLRAGRYRQMVSHLRMAWKWRARSVLSRRGLALLGNGIIFRIRRLQRSRV